MRKSLQPAKMSLDLYHQMWRALKPHLIFSTVRDKSEENPLNLKSTPMVTTFICSAELDIKLVKLEHFSWKKKMNQFSSERAPVYVHPLIL